MKAFSTSSCAVLLARGSLREVPASGAMTTKIVRALRVQAGTCAVFLATATERESAERKIARSATRRRIVMEASIRLGGWEEYTPFGRSEVKWLLLDGVRRDFTTEGAEFAEGEAGCLSSMNDLCSQTRRMKSGERFWETNVPDGWS